MAQVYSFVDENGVTRLFAEIQPDPAGTPFNGGTITGELIVNTAATNTQALELTGTRTGNVEVFGIDYPHTVVDITSDGVALIASDDNMAMTVRGDSDSGASLEVLNNPTGQLVQLGAGSGALNSAMIRVKNQGDGKALFYGSGGADFLIQEDGTPRIFAHAAPADGALVAGELALWFDQTNGAAKLMVKAKQADGTVRTGSLALT